MKNLIFLLLLVDSVFSCPVVDSFRCKMDPIAFEPVQVTFLAKPTGEDGEQVIDHRYIYVDGSQVSEGQEYIYLAGATDHTVTGVVVWHWEKKPWDNPDVNAGPISPRSYAKIIENAGDNQIVPKNTTAADPIKAYLYDWDGDAVNSVSVNFSEGTTTDSETSDSEGIATVSLDVSTAKKYSCEADGAYVYNAVMFDETVFSLTLTNADVTVTRGVAGINASVSPTTFSPNSFIWTFTGGAGGILTTSNNSAGVILVDSDNQYTVKCKMVYGADNKTYETAAANIVVQARSDWSISPSCLQDNDPNWGGFPGSQLFGQFLNQNGANAVMTPQDSSGATVSKVTTEGPNKNYWYVSGSTYAINMETLINKYFKQGTTPPNPPNTNLYEYNKAKGVTVDTIVTAIRNHEYMGSATGGGHYKKLLASLATSGRNLGSEIEKYFDATSKDSLTAKIETKRTDLEDLLWRTAVNPAPTGNWSGSLYIYYFSESKWDTWDTSF